MAKIVKVDHPREDEVYEATERIVVNDVLVATPGTRITRADAERWGLIERHADPEKAEAAEAAALEEGPDERAVAPDDQDTVVAAPPPPQRGRPRRSSASPGR